MNRLVEVFCATQRHQKTKNKKNETQTKVRMALHVSKHDVVPKNPNIMYYIP